MGNPRSPAGADGGSRQEPTNHLRDATTAQHPLLGYLFHLLWDWCLARLGPGVRFVARKSAARLECGSHMACADRVLHVGKERLERGLPALEVALPSSLSRHSG